MPTAPVLVVASESEDGSVVTWTDVDEAIYYRLKVDGAFHGDNIPTGIETHTLELPVGTYSVTLTAFGTGGSAESDAVEVGIPDQTPPSAITDLAVVEVGDGYFAYAFTEPTDNVGMAYYERVLDDVVLPGTVIPDAVQPLFVFDVENGVGHTFRLVAYDGASPANSTASNLVTGIVTGDVTPPDAITDLAVTLRTSDSAPVLAWTNPDAIDVANANVYRDAVPSTGWALLPDMPIPAIAGQQGTFADETAPIGSSFRYRVTTLDDEDPANESAPSNEYEIAVTDVTKPTKPVIGLDAGDGQVTISLTTASTDNIAVASYTLCYTTDGTEPTKSSNPITGLTALSFPYVLSVANGTTVKAALFALDAVPNESDLSDVVTGTPAPAFGAFTVALSDTVKRKDATGTPGNGVTATVSGVPAGHTVWLYDDHGGADDHLLYPLGDAAAAYDAVSGDYELELLLDPAGDPAYYTVAAWVEEADAHSSNSVQLTIWDAGVTETTAPASGLTFTEGEVVTFTQRTRQGANAPGASGYVRYSTVSGASSWTVIPGTTVLAADATALEGGDVLEYSVSVTIPSNTSIKWFDFVEENTYGHLTGDPISATVVAAGSNEPPVVTLDAMPVGTEEGAQLDITFTVTDDAAITLANITAELDYTTTPIAADSITLVSGSQYRARWNAAPADGDHPVRVAYTDAGSATGADTDTVSLVAVLPLVYSNTFDDANDVTIASSVPETNTTAASWQGAGSSTSAYACDGAGAIEPFGQSNGGHVYIDVGVAKPQIEADIVPPAAGAYEGRIILRHTSTTNYLYLLFNGNKTAMGKVVAGTQTELDTAGALTRGVSSEIVVVEDPASNLITGYVDGVATLSMNDAALAGNTEQGMRCGTTGWKCNRFAIRDNG